jgi:hypothetical protein
VAGKGLEDAFHRLAVFGAPGERAVEIDHMKELCAGFGK